MAKLAAGCYVYARIRHIHKPWYTYIVKYNLATYFSLLFRIDLWSPLSISPSIIIYKTIGIDLLRT